MKPQILPVLVDGHKGLIIITSDVTAVLQVGIGLGSKELPVSLPKQQMNLLRDNYRCDVRVQVGKHSMVVRSAA